MNFVELSLPGCFMVEAGAFKDARGSFVKPFALSEFSRRGLRADFAEQYYSVSRPGVIRGMHFQRPPADHAKLVKFWTYFWICVAGLQLTEDFKLSLYPPKKLTQCTCRRGSLTDSRYEGVAQRR